MLMLHGFRRSKSAIALVVLLQFIVILSVSGITSAADSTPSARNVILIIADGMQREHERAASNYLYGNPESGLEHQKFPYKGSASTWDISTYNRYAYTYGAALISDSSFDPQNAAGFNALLGYDPSKGGKLPWRQDTTGQTAYFGTRLKSGATAGGAYPAADSASAATALSTGFKTDDGNVAWRTGDPANGRLTTIAEMFRRQRKAAIGVVSTVPFSHATPAAFVSHNVYRDNYTAIAQEIIAGIRPEVVIGGGHPAFNSAAGQADYSFIDATEYDSLKNSREYVLAERKVGVDGGSALLAAADRAAVGGKKLFGLFGGAGGSFEFHKPSNIGSAGIVRGSIENPTLADAARAALKVLSRNRNGFFLLVEQGDIDWSNHANDYAGMIGGIWDLNNAVKAVEAFIDQPGDDISWENTLVIVTADHANGYLRLKKDLAKGVLPSQTRNGPGAPAGYDRTVACYYDPSQVTYGFSEKGLNSHTNELVSLYARGAGSDSFRGFEGLWYPGTHIVDNTQIFRAMLISLGLTDENRSRVSVPRSSTFLNTSDAP